MSKFQAACLWSLQDFLGSYLQKHSLIEKTKPQETHATDNFYYFFLVLQLYFRVSSSLSIPIAHFCSSVCGKMMNHSIPFSLINKSFETELYCSCCSMFKFRLIQKPFFRSEMKLCASYLNIRVCKEGWIYTLLYLFCVLISMHCLRVLLVL